MSELREHFRASVVPRLAEMRGLLDALLRGEGDLPAVGRHFHFLAGMGSTFGYPRITALGDEAEELLVPLLKRAEAASPVLIAQLQTLVDKVAAELGE